MKQDGRKKERRFISIIQKFDGGRIEDSTHLVLKDDHLNFVNGTILSNICSR